MGGSSSKLARRSSKAGSAAPPSPAKKKRDSKKALATLTKDLLACSAPTRRAAALADVRAARFAADFDRDFDADEPAAGGPSRGMLCGWEKLADGLAEEVLRLRAFDSAADAFARLVRSNNDRAAATFAVLVNRLERSMTKRENVANDTALLRMLRTMHHRSGKTLVAVMRNRNRWSRRCSTCSCTLARASSTSASTACRRALRQGHRLPLQREPDERRWWKDMNGTPRDGEVNVFFQEVDDVDDYMDEGEEGGAPRRRRAAVAVARPARVAGGVAVARAPRVEHAARRRCRFHRHRHRRRRGAPAPAPAAAVLAAAVAAASSASAAGAGLRSARRRRQSTCAAARRSPR